MLLPRRAREHLAAGEVRALQDQEDAKARFRRWAAQRVPDAKHMNICSGPQARPHPCLFVLMNIFAKMQESQRAHWSSIQPLCVSCNIAVPRPFVYTLQLMCSEHLRSDGRGVEL